MKRAIVKFGTAILLAGMFVMIPSCKNEAKEEATEEVVVEDAAMTPVDSPLVDTGGIKDPKPGGNPAGPG